MYSVYRPDRGNSPIPALSGNFLCRPPAANQVPSLYNGNLHTDLFCGVAAHLPVHIRENFAAEMLRPHTVVHEHNGIWVLNRDGRPAADLNLFPP